MSTPMPDFEMPAAEQDVSAAPAPDGAAAAAGHPIGAPPVRPTAGVPALDASDLTAEPEASDDRPPARPRLAWRQLLVAGLVGALLGAAVPASIQGIERAAAAAEVDAVRSLATDYLTAIAEGRAADATAMVPLRSRAGEIAPDAVLAAARRIEGIDVGLVAVEGEAATVAVQYEGVGVSRQVLDAERVDGRWRLTTSLAEPVSVYPGQLGDVPMIAGTPLVDRRTHLYPGSYSLDEVAGPVFRTSGQPFVVDGDRATSVEVFTMTALVPDVATMANEIALRAGEVCMASPRCRIPEGARLTVQQEAYVQTSDARQGTVDLGVPLMAGVGPSSEWFEITMRLHHDEEGVPIAWECGRPGEFGTDLLPCPALG